MPVENAITVLRLENQKLRDALANLIPWAGELPEGPAWATPDAKSRNRDMCEKALAAAWDCFPPNYNGITEALRSN